jgi:hypothetical protein
MMPATLTFENTPDDVRDMQRHYLRHGKYRWTALRPAFLQLLLVIWALLAATLAYFTYEAIAFFMLLGAAAAFALVALVWALAALRLPSAEAARWRKDPYLRQRGLGRQSVEISAEGLLWTHQVGEGRVAWAGISSVERGEHGVYFYLGPAQVVSVPAHAFGSPDEMARFAAEAEGYRAQAAQPVVA